MRVRPSVWLTAIVLLAAGGVALLTRGMGFTARAEPGSVEERLALAARRWATPRDVRSQTSPVPPTSEAVRGAMEHWADHCAGCHGNDGSGRTSIGKSFYPPVPDMRADRTQRMTDGELFYVIERGVPFTGMPAWGNGTADGERQSWELVLFIRYLPSLGENEIADMEKLNPRSAAQIEEERRVNDFLAGGR